MNKQRGFIALISALLISAVLLGLAATLCFSSVAARTGALFGEYHRVAQSLAESCANVALLKVAQDYDYDPTLDSTFVPGSGVPVLVGQDAQGQSERCLIRSIQYQVDVFNHAKTTTLMTQGHYRDSFAATEVVALVRDPSFAQPTLQPNISIVSWRQIQ